MGQSSRQHEASPRFLRADPPGGPAIIFSHVFQRGKKQMSDRQILFAQVDQCTLRAKSAGKKREVSPRSGFRNLLHLFDETFPDLVGIGFGMKFGEEPDECVKGSSGRDVSNGAEKFPVKIRAHLVGAR